MVRIESGLKLYHVVVFGSGGVGKSCITGQFVETYDPTIEDSYRKQVVVDKEECFLDVLDTAGQEDFALVREQYAKAGDGFLLVYSVSDSTSLQCLTGHLEAIASMKCPGLKKEDARSQRSFCVVVCGNKSDLPADRQKVSESEGRELARSWNAQFFPTSAKNNVNVEEAFFELVRMMRKLPSSETAEKKKKGGCSLL